MALDKLKELKEKLVAIKSNNISDDEKYLLSNFIFYCEETEKNKGIASQSIIDLMETTIKEYKDFV